MSEWIEHDGISNPFLLTIEARLRDGRIMTGRPQHFAWMWGDEEWPSDIIAYRIVKTEDAA